MANIFILIISNILSSSLSCQITAVRSPALKQKAFCQPNTCSGPDTLQRGFGQAANQGILQHQLLRLQSHKASTVTKFMLWVNYASNFH